MIHKAQKQERRIRLHSEALVSGTNRALTELLDEFVRVHLVEEKYDMFVDSLRLPIKTTALMDRIYTALFSIFDGRNPAYKYEFVNSDLLPDWKEYRERKLKALEKWKTVGFEVMKTEVNSLVVVDLPEEQTGERPEPYFYFLSLEHLVDIDMVDAETVDYVVVRSGTDIVVFDDECYRIFETEENDRNQIIQPAKLEAKHDLKYCPVNFFWSTPINHRTPIVKRHPASMQLSRLDELFLFDHGNTNLNSYARYPIISTFAGDCNFEDLNTGAVCDRGFIRSADGYYSVTGANEVQKCPVCHDKRFNGPGSIVEIDPPSAENEKVDLRNPIQWIEASRDLLDYNNEDIENRENKIFCAVTGFYGHSINNKSVNADQINAIFESQESALRMPQYNFEKIIQWVDKTICKLRYGKAFVSASVSLGTDHYIMTSAEILKMYQEAKTNSLGTAVLDILEDKYFETEFRNNPDQLARQMILKNIDPFRHLSNSEVVAMYEKGSVRYIDYLIKINLSTFVARFERENIPIVGFAENLNFRKKIEVIRSEFEKYAKEMKVPESEIKKEVIV